MEKKTPFYFRNISLLRRLFVNQFLFWSSGGKKRLVAYVLQIKVNQKILVEVREKDCLDVINITFATWASASFGSAK